MDEWLGLLVILLFVWGINRVIINYFARKAVESE